MSHHRGDREEDEDPMVEVDEEEVPNDADVFRIADLVGGPEGEDIIENVPAELRERQIKRLDDLQVEVNVAPKAKAEGGKSEDSSDDPSSFELSDEGAADEIEEDDDLPKGKDKGADTSSYSVNPMIDRELQSEFVPNFEIKYDKTAKIEYIGDVIHVIGPKENRAIVIKHKASSHALDIDSILCLNDRSFLGVVNETFGPIINPFYRVYISRPEKKSAVPQSEEPVKEVQEVQTTPADSAPPTEGKTEEKKEESPAPPTDEAVKTAENLTESKKIDNTEVKPVEEHFPPRANVDDVIIGTKVYFVIDEKQYLIPSQLLMATQLALLDDADDSEDVYFSDDEKEKEYMAAKRKRKEDKSDQKRNKKARTDDSFSNRNSNNQNREYRQNHGNNDRRGNHNNSNYQRQHNHPGGHPQDRFPNQGGYYPMSVPGYTQHHYPQHYNSMVAPNLTPNFAPYNPNMAFQQMQPPPQYGGGDFNQHGGYHQQQHGEYNQQGGQQGQRRYPQQGQQGNYNQQGGYNQGYNYGGYPPQRPY